MVDQRIGGRPQVAYITLNGRIPSTTANSVGVMSMCDQFAAQGLRTLLLVPGGQAVSMEKLGHSGDIWSFYSIERKFAIRYFPNAFSGRLVYFSSAYSLLMVLYARMKGIRFITTRNLEVALWAARLRIPVVLESHNFSRFAKVRGVRAWIRLMQDRSKRVSMLVTTYAGKRSYVAFGAPEDRIEVLPNGVSIERFEELESKVSLRQQLGLPISNTLVVFSGSLQEGRGGEEMLACAALLPEMRFVIVGGSPDDVEKYKALAVSTGTRNVIFIGHVTQAAVPRYLLAADVLVMPYSRKFSAHSFEYTSPMKMFEYLATGRPTVATDFPILHEVLENGRNVIFVEPDSGKALAEGIDRLLKDPALANRIAENAKADARKYSWKNRVARIVEWQQTLGHLES